MTKKTYTHRCQRCGGAFASPGTSAKYCPACKQAEHRERQRKKAQAKGTAMVTKRRENRQYYMGCQGCVDWAGRGGGCAYLDHYGRCRPWASKPGGGCAGWTDKRRQQSEVELVPWDTRKAKGLLRRGKTLEEAAQVLECSKNALESWARREIRDKR